MDNEDMELAAKGQTDIFSGRPFEQVYRRLANQPRIDSIEVLDQLWADEFHSRVLPAEYEVVFRAPKLFPPAEAILEELKEVTAEIKVRRGNYAIPEIYFAEREYVSMTLREYTETYLSVHRKSVPVIVHVDNRFLDLSLGSRRLDRGWACALRRAHPECPLVFLLRSVLPRPTALIIGAYSLLGCTLERTTATAFRNASPTE